MQPTMNVAMMSDELMRLILSPPFAMGAIQAAVYEQNMKTRLRF
jgi:hypothetical protein